MSITYNDLISRAEQVRDESEIGANTATRVGQLLADIIQWCQDNNADLGDYLLNFTAHLNESGGILNWFQSRIVLLKTMGSAYDDVSVGSLSDGDVYYDSQGNWIREKSGSATINGIHPSKGVFYVNLANQTAYQWDGTTFQVAIESGSGGGASTVTAFEGYEVIESVAELPEQGDPVTGYIVGTHIYAYVGENGDTADGAYQDLGDLGVDPDIYQPKLIAGDGISIAQDGKTVSVDAEVVQPVTPDGTFAIRIGTNTYTINLNHTHEGMAKLVVDTAANLPDASEMESDTIYGELDDGEIATIYLGGVPFYGGGTSSGPVLRRPADGATIDMGQTTSGTVSQTINVKGKNLTQALIIQLTGTGYTFGTTQPSGVTRDSSTQLTVTAAAANTLNGVDIAVVYTGNDTDEDAEGTIGISSSSVDDISVEVTLVANKVTYTDLAAVKLTGTQWLQTDYYPNANTEFRLTCRFEQRSDTQSTSKDLHEGFILSCKLGTSGKEFTLRNMNATSNNPYNPWNIGFTNETSILYGNDYQIIPIGNDEGTRPYILVDPVQIGYTKGTSNGTIGFTDGTHTLTKPTSLKSSTQENAMMIGRYEGDGNAMTYSIWNLTIYSLVITENGNEVRHWVPKMKNSTIPGLLDISTNGSHEFISSETAKTSGLASDELVAIPLT